MRHRSICLPLLLLGAAASACRSVPDRPAFPPADRPADLAEAVRAVERTYAGEALPVDPRRHLARVDYRSRIDLRFDRDRLLEVARSLGGREGALPPEPPDAAANRRRSVRLIEILERHAQSVRRTEKELEEFRAKTFLAPADREKRRQELLAQVGSEGAQAAEVRQAAMAAVEAEARRQGIPVAKDAAGMFHKDYLQLLDRTYEELYPLSEGLNVEGMTRLLNGEYFQVRRRLDAAAEAAERAGAVRFRVRATLHKPGESGPIPLHLPGYDTIDAGVGPIKRAISFNLSPKDQERLREDLQTAAEFARLYNDFRARKPELKAKLRELRQGFEADLRAIGEKLRGLATQGTLEQAMADLVARLEDPAVRQALGAGADQGLAAARKAREFAKSVRETLALLEGASGQPDEVLAAVVGGASKALAALADLASSAPQVVKAFEGAFAALRLAETKEALKEWAAGLLKRLAADLVQELDATLAKVQDLLGPAKVFLQLFRQHEAPDRMDFAGVDPRVLTRGLDQAVPTEISISSSPADGGDRVVLHVELLRPEEGAEVVAAAFEQEFAVERMGLNSRVGAHVVFVKRVDEPRGGTVPETNFEAAPAASWTLHHRWRGEGWLARTLNVLDPAVGLGVGALQFENDGVELGVGAHASFFGDLVQVGYGLNLNVGKERDFFYVGVGLTDLLNVASVGLRRALGEAPR